MRIPKSWIPLITNRIIDNLVSDELIEADFERDELYAEINHLITEELSAEDKLNDEVREILKKFEDEIADGRMDYRKLFDLTKHKLIRERNIVI